MNDITVLSEGLAINIDAFSKSELLFILKYSKEIRNYLLL